MFRASKLLTYFVLALGLTLGGAVGCGGDDDEGDMGPGPVTGRDPAEPNPTYAVPADRIDPSTARDFSNAQFMALGAARSGPDGNGVAPSTTAARYVSAVNGSDSNDGTAGNAWRTLQHAADTAAPGTRVLVDSSADYTGGLRVSRSGSEGAWIVFVGENTSNPPRLVGGMDEDAVVDIDASYVAFVGFEIADHVRGGNSTDEIGIQVEPRNGDISHVWILNNIVRNIGPPDVGGASCVYNAHGIIAQSDGYRIANLIIDGNELHHLYVGNSECLVVNGLVEEFRVTNNYIHEVNNIALDIIGYEKNAKETTSQGLVADNVILDASNYWPYCGRGNCTYPEGDESSDGIYVDGGADLIIEYNVVGRTDHGIELQSENGELIRNTDVRYNVVFNSNYRQITVGQVENSTAYDNEEVNRAELADSEFEACR